MHSKVWFLFCFSIVSLGAMERTTAESAVNEAVNKRKPDTLKPALKVSKYSSQDSLPESSLIPPFKQKLDLDPCTKEILTFYKLNPLVRGAKLSKEELINLYENNIGKLLSPITSSEEDIIIFDSFSLSDDKLKLSDDELKLSDDELQAMAENLYWAKDRWEKRYRLDIKEPKNYNEGVFVENKDLGDSQESGRVNTNGSKGVSFGKELIYRIEGIDVSKKPKKTNYGKFQGYFRTEYKGGFLSCVYPNEHKGLGDDLSGVEKNSLDINFYDQKGSIHGDSTGLQKTDRFLLTLDRLNGYYKKNGISAFTIKKDGEEMSYEEYKEHLKKKEEKYISKGNDLLSSSVMENKPSGSTIKKKKLLKLIQGEED